MSNGESEKINVASADFGPTYTRDQLIGILQAQRREMENFLKTLDLPPNVGKEYILQTTAGEVRVLGYNMDNPARLPLFIDLHGSGFVVGHAEMDDPFMMRLCVGAQIKVFNVDYSLAPENPFPRAIEEIFAVVRYAKAHADELGIDPQRIAVGGHSAGGNFAAAVALMDVDRQELGLRGLILDYPPLDVYTDASEKPSPAGGIPVESARISDASYHLDREGRKNPLISPLFATPEQLRHFPPTQIITAGLDTLCAEAVRFSEKLQSAGVLVDHRHFPDSLHGFTHQPVPEADAAWQMMIDFLKLNLGENT
jgi:acetyl esterase